MALITKTKLTPGYNWKYLTIEDITGTGITGYGANQDPINNRRASSAGTDISATNIYITAPDETETEINLDDEDAYTTTTTPYTVTNIDLGFLEDDYITDGIWKVEYVPYFSTGGILTYADEELTFNLSNKLFFINATRLKLIDETAAEFNVIITNINFTTGVITYTGDDLSGIGGIDEVWIGIGTTTYTVFAKEIKECLDNKVADEYLCPCECEDCELVKKYLLYDAMYLNCLTNNITKAQQIFDYLTNFCTTTCGC